MSRDNPLWGAPRIHGELLKLGINVGETSVGKYMVRHRKPPSQTWRTFLDNHVKSMVSWTSSRCRRSASRPYTYSWFWPTTGAGLSTSVSPAHPTAEWTVKQLHEAFPWDAAPRHLLRDRDRIFSDHFVEQVKAMGIREVLSAPRSPWHRAYVERVIGTIRRECLDHGIVFNQAALYRHIQNFVSYHHGSRTHVGLDKQCPHVRQVSNVGRIVKILQLGGLHHRYERVAAWRHARGRIFWRRTTSTGTIAQQKLAEAASLQPLPTRL